ELHVRPSTNGGPKLVYAGGPGDIEKLDQQIASLERQLAEWKRARDADPAFVAERTRELSDLRAERAARAQRGGSPPPAGSWFTSTLVAVRHSVVADPQVRTAMRALDRQVGADNRKRDCAQPKPALREPHYVGMASCGESGCHPKAVALWKKTVHAGAWKTLL